MSYNPQPFSTNLASICPLTAKGTIAQSANLTEWKDVADTVVAAVSPAGSITGNILNLSTSPATGTYAEGKLYYDAVNKSHVAEVGGNITLGLTKHLTTLVYNNTASTLLAGKAVKLSSSTPGQLDATLAIAAGIAGLSFTCAAGVVTVTMAAHGYPTGTYATTSQSSNIVSLPNGFYPITVVDSNSFRITAGSGTTAGTCTAFLPNQVSGIVIKDILPAASGLIMCAGKLENVDTSTFTVGDILYLSDATPGGYVAGTTALAYASRVNKIGQVTQKDASTGQIYVSIDNENANLSITDIQRNILEGNTVSTGVYAFAGATLNGSNPTHAVDIPAVKGWIVNNTGAYYSTTPSVTNVVYAGATAIIPDYINTQDATYFLLNSSAGITQQYTIPTPQQRRESIFLFKVAHPNRSTILYINNTTDYDCSPMSALRDMFSPIPLINDGITCGPDGANLSFYTTAGYLYGMGINWAVNEKSPNQFYVGANAGVPPFGNTVVNFYRRTRTGGSTGIVTTVDPGNYDVAGTVTAIPTITPAKADADQATNQRVYLYPTGVVNVQYGQHVYANLATALAAQQKEIFVKAPNAAGAAILIGIIAVRKAATDLSLITDAVFTPASVFGESIGGVNGISTTTLQQAYNNSVTPEIVTNDIQGPVSLKSGATGGDIANVFETINSSNATTSSITGGGAASFSGLLSTGGITVSGLSTYNTGATFSYADATAKNAHRTAMGVGTGDDVLFGQITLGTIGVGTNALRWSSDGILTFYRSSTGTSVMSINTGANSISVGSVTTGSIISNVATPAKIEFATTYVTDLRSGTNPHKLRVFGSFTARGSGTTSLECLDLHGAASAPFVIQSMKGSVGGTARDIEIRHGATDTNNVITDGALVATFAVGGMAIPGTLGVTGAATVTGLLTPTGNIAVPNALQQLDFLQGALSGPGSVEVQAGSLTIVRGTSTLFTKTFRVGDTITVGAVPKVVSAITSDTLLTVSVAFVGAVAALTAYTITARTSASLDGAGQLSVNSLKLISNTLPTTPVAGAIEFLTDKVYATTTTGPTRKELGFKNLAARITVGTMGDFATVKAAVDWFNANATGPTSILVDGGNHVIAATVTVNSTGGHPLCICGLASSLTALNAGTGLAGTPMFNIVTPCDFSKISCNGSTLAGYGTNAGENCFSFATTQNVYSEITDIIINTFTIGINDTIGSNIFVFNFVISTCQTGIAINYTSNSPTTITSLDAEIGTIQYCPIGINLLKTGAAKKAKFYLYALFFEHLLSTDIGIKYTTTDYAYADIAYVSGCTFNNIGSLDSGFDFSNAVNANITTVGNAGIEDSKPHAKINVYNNASTTTITTAGAYYKAVFTNGATYAKKITLAANKMTYQSILPCDGMMWLSGSMLTSRNSGNMDICIRKEIPVTSVVGNGTTVTVTCTLSHGLDNLQQVQMLGWSNAAHNGVKTITKVSDTVFTYLSGTAATSTGGTCGALLSITSVKGNAVATNVTTFSLNCYVEDMLLNSYYEIYVTCANSGDTVTLSDVSWLFLAT